MYLILALSVLVLYCLASAAIAWRNRKVGDQSFRDYAVGYSSISTPVLISGIMAASLGEGSTIDNAADLFAIGLPFAIIQCLQPISWWISSKIFPRKI